MVDTVRTDSSDNANRLRTRLWWCPPGEPTFDCTDVSVLFNTGMFTYLTGTRVAFATASWMDSFRPRTAPSDRLSRSMPVRAIDASTVTLWATVGAPLGTVVGLTLISGDIVGARLGYRVGVAVGV